MEPNEHEENEHEQKQRMYREMMSKILSGKVLHQDNNQPDNNQQDNNKEYYYTLLSRDETKVIFRGKMLLTAFMDTVKPLFEHIKLVDDYDNITYKVTK